MKKDSPNRRWVFYGWWVVLAVAAVRFATLGCGFYILPVTFKSWITEFNWSRTQVSVTTSIYTLALAVFAPVVGGLCDKYGAKKVMFLWAVPLGVGIVLLGLVGSLWQLYLAYGVVSVASAGLFNTAPATLINRWFVRKRGIAQALVTVGGPLGGLAMSPAMAVLIIAFGWRLAFIAMGILAAVISLPAILFGIKDNPERMGLFPDGDSRAVPAPTSTDPSRLGKRTADLGGRQWTTRMALKTTAFWAMAIAYFWVGVGYIGILAHQVNYFTDLGIGLVPAATTAGVSAGAGIIGALAAGYLADRMPTVYVGVMSFVLQALGIFILIEGGSTDVVWIFAFLFGAGSVATIPVRAALVGELFGRESFGSIYGLVEMVRCIGATIGPLFAGMVFDLVGSYTTVFAVFIAGYGLATVSILFARQPKMPGQA